MSDTYLARYPAVLQGCPTMRFLASTPTSAYATTPLPPPTSLHTHTTLLYTMATDAAPLKITYCGGTTQLHL
jgi:hypothetical protein